MYVFFDYLQFALWNCNTSRLPNFRKQFSRNLKSAAKNYMKLMK